MPRSYRGDNGKDVVNQTQKNDYFNIYTKGGNDAISLTLTNTYVLAGEDNDTVTSNIEGRNDISLGSGDDTYVGTGFSNNTNRYDEVSGGSGNDSFTVMTNVSGYYGGSGKDFMASAGYRNQFDGGDGNDTISYMAQDDDKFLRGKGVQVDLEAEYGFTGSDRVEDLFDFENAQGTSFMDTLRGGASDNKLWGMNGADLLDGRGGKDKLYGGAGNDDLYGGSLGDRLDGGGGTDFLIGDTGSDLFVFASFKDTVKGSDRDVITDFSRSDNDRIDVSQIDAIKGTGNDDFNYIGGAEFKNAGDLRFENNILSGDIDGDGMADFQVRVREIGKLTEGDFIL